MARPPIYDKPMQKTRIVLREPDSHLLEYLGGGNRSAGLRHVLDFIRDKDLVSTILNGENGAAHD